MVLLSNANCHDIFNYKKEIILNKEKTHKVSWFKCVKANYIWIVISWYKATTLNQKVNKDSEKIMTEIKTEAHKEKERREKKRRNDTDN